MEDLSATDLPEPSGNETPTPENADLLVDESVTPITETPKSEIAQSPKTPSPRTQSPKTESPKTQSPRTQSSKAQSPLVESPKSESVPISLKQYPAMEIERIPSIKSPKQPSRSVTPNTAAPLSPQTLRSNPIHNTDEVADLAMKTTDILEKYLNPASPSHKSNNTTRTEPGIASKVVSSQSNGITNIDKIATMSKALTDDAKALRESIKCLTQDISHSKQELHNFTSEDVNFPYHLFLIEIIINKIHMKCECFDVDYNNLVISATFLGKQPIILYDSSYGKIESFSKLNVGKSSLFAMTYDKICSIDDFEIVLFLTKQPPCSNCVTKIAETHMDYTSEFVALREELCAKWKKHHPKDNILCTTSTPLSKNMYYLSCGFGDSMESIGIIEVTVRMSFLGKEITTNFCAQPKPQGTSFLLKEDHGMTMYSCQKVEMDDYGKILLDEGVMTKKTPPCAIDIPQRMESPHSIVCSSASTKRSYESPYGHDNYERSPRYDEIYTKMNVNELKIRVPKSTKIERLGRYDKIQELCSCESTAYNSGEQIQFELPKDNVYPEKTYTSNLKYTMRGIEKPDKKDRKIINVTPTNCAVPVNMSKMLHPQKDVFILKIGKKLETKDKKTDLEIELVTPKAPSENHVETGKNSSAQCSDSEIDKCVKKKKGKSKNKKDTAGKSKKGKAKKSKAKK